MILNDDVISRLIEVSEEPEQTISGYWKMRYEGVQIDQGRVVSGIGPEGFLPQRPIPKRIAHYLLQSRYRHMGRNFPHFKTYMRIGRDLAKRRKCQFDLSMLRHVLTLAMISNHIQINEMREPIVVIGDGHGAMGSLVSSCFPSVKVVQVNLTKSLLLDMAFTRLGLPTTDICLAQDLSEYQSALESPNIPVVAIRADDAPWIGEAPIGLAINTASMGEMDYPVIAAYFDAMRQSPNPTTLFYCSNRIEKISYGGVAVRFDDYPWSVEDDNLVDELCPWHQSFYSLRWPFYRPYSGPIRHRLTRMSKTPATTSNG